MEAEVEAEVVTVAVVPVVPPVVVVAPVPDVVLSDDRTLDVILFSLFWIFVFYFVIFFC